jgi:hypothetical protein
MGHFNGVPVAKLVEMPFQQRQVNGVDMFVIIFAAAVSGGQFPVYEIVIQADLVGGRSEPIEFCSQPSGEGGFSGRGRARQPDPLNRIIVRRNLLGNLDDLPLLCRFFQADIFFKVSVSDDFIQLWL